MFKKWKEAFDYQQKEKSTCDNGFYGDLMFNTGVENIDNLAYTVGNVVWLIMADNFDLGDYNEWATEYGVTQDGKWCAVYDSHCSCYGWEADESDITYYNSLEQLLAADEKASVIIRYKDKIKEVYEFVEFQ
jgi:hypothetical protein